MNANIAGGTPVAHNHNRGENLFRKKADKKRTVSKPHYFIPLHSTPHQNHTPHPPNTPPHHTTTPSPPPNTTPHHTTSHFCYFFHYITPYHTTLQQIYLANPAKEQRTARSQPRQAIEDRQDLTLLLLYCKTHPNPLKSNVSPKQNGCSSSKWVNPSRTSITHVLLVQLLGMSKGFLFNFSSATNYVPKNTVAILSGSTPLEPTEHTFFGFTLLGTSIGLLEILQYSSGPSIVPVYSSGPSIVPVYSSDPSIVPVYSSSGPSIVPVCSISGPSIVPVCASQQYRHCSGNRHYSAHRHTGQSHLCQAIAAATGTN